MPARLARRSGRSANSPCPNLPAGVAWRAVDRPGSPLLWTSLTCAARDRPAPRCRVEAHAIARAIPRRLAQSRVATSPGPASRLLVVVRLSSERARQAVRHDCSFAKKPASPRAFLVVVEAVAQTVEGVASVGRRLMGPRNVGGRARRCDLGGAVQAPTAASLDPPLSAWVGFRVTSSRAVRIGIAEVSISDPGGHPVGEPYGSRWNGRSHGGR